jgi:uncharacterized protein
VNPPPLARAFTAWTLKHGRLLWIVAVLLAIPATFRTASLYLHLRSDLEALLPRQSASVRAIDELRARMPGLQYLGVIVDTGGEDRLGQGEKFLDDLAARVRTYPPELVRAVRLGQSEERAFLEKHAALYTDVADLKTIRERIEARRDWEVSHETGASLDDDEKPPALDFSDIEKKYDERLGRKGGKTNGDRFSSGELHLTLMLIELGEFETAGGRNEALLDRVRSDIAALGGTDKYAPGMRLGFTGDVAIAVEETSALMADLSFSSVVVTFLVIAVIIGYYRWWKATLVLLPPLLLATVYAFGIGSLPPLNIRELNSNTAFLGSIIVGNGVNFGIILLARYVEERRRGVSVEQALPVAVWGSRPGTLSAAFAAAVSYASLALTDFQGFRQFGFIGGIGMVLSWGVAYLLMPSLIARLDDGGAMNGAKSQGRLMTPVASFVTRHSAVVAAIAALLTVGAALAVRSLPSQALEYDFSKLRRADTWESGEGYWGRRMDTLLGTYLTPTVILADSEKEARRIGIDLKKATEAEPLTSMVSQVRTVDDVLPQDQDAKLAEAEAIREDMTPKMRSLVDASKKEQIDRLLDTEPVKVTLGDLPRTFTTGMRERDGTIGKAVLVYPRPTHALWEGPALAQFVDALRAIAKGPENARVAGSLPLSADILDSIRKDGLKASLAALVGVMVVVVVIFRHGTTSALVIVSLVTGVLWLAAAMMLLRVRINFANFIAFPITFGIGVDYAVNVMSRYVQDDSRDISAAIRSTGGAVTLCSMTTIIGYSSLLMAENRALYLFGLVAVLGEICCLSAAVVALPGVLAWARALRAKKGTTGDIGRPTA